MMTTLNTAFSYLITIVLSSGLAILLSIFLLMMVMRIRRNRTYHYLSQFPGKREPIPLLSHIKMYQSILKTSREGGIPTSTLMFNALNSISLPYKTGVCSMYVAGGPHMWIWRADHIEQLLTHPTNLNKGHAYHFMKHLLGDGLLISPAKKWRPMRKLLTPAFHFRILEDFSKLMNQNAEIFTGKMANKDAQGNIVPHIAACTLDITCETVMGVSINSQGSESGRKYLHGISRLSELIVDRMSYPSQWNDFIFSFTAEGKEHAELLKGVHGFTSEVIEKRKRELQETMKFDQVKDISEDLVKLKKPFLDMMLTQHLKGEMSIDDIRNEVDTFMFGGHDTTSMGLTYAIYLIGLHPEVQKKLQKEIDSVFGKEECEVTIEHLKNLKYLEMTLKESQRVYPSVPIISRILSEDMIIDGKTVPKGTDVQCFIYGLHRDPAVFPKPEEFIPERFSAESSIGRNPFAFIPFSAGPRNCIGQKFAFIEEKIILVWLLRRYNLRSLDARDRMELVAEIVLRPRNKVRVEFQRRNRS